MKWTVTLFFVSLLIITQSVPASSQANDLLRDVRLIDGLPFCALILDDSYNKDDRERTVDVFMAPCVVTESNLHLLFRLLSNKYPEDPSLVVWVNTHIERLSTLVTGDGGSGPGQQKRVFQFAYYTRTNTLELFRYNPDYPKAGEKTVIIRGKEE